MTLFASDPGGTYVVLGVSDTGIGIAADDLPRVLEPFGQVENIFHADPRRHRPRPAACQDADRLAWRACSDR